MVILLKLRRRIKLYVVICLFRGRITIVISLFSVLSWTTFIALSYTDWVKEEQKEYLKPID